METVIKGVGAVGGAAVKQIPEVQDALPLPEPESGVSWTTGLGIAGIVLILAAAVYKSKCCKK